MASIPQINTQDLQSDINQVESSPAVIIAEKSFLDQTVQKDIQLEKLKTLKEYNKTLSQNNDERKTYAKRIFNLTCIWTFLIFGIVLLQGFKLMDLSDKVLITLITSTTINLFGFFLLVTKYLFNVSQKEGKGKSAKGKNRKVLD